MPETQHAECSERVVTGTAPHGAPAPPDPGRWRELPATAGVPPFTRVFGRRVSDGELFVLVSREPWDVGDWRWHLSISHPRRHPTWDEIAQARYDLIPDAVTMGMYLPPRAEYVNVHPHCFHLTESREA